MTMHTFDELVSTLRKRRLVLLRDDLAEHGRAVLVTPAAGISEAEVNVILTVTGGHLNVALSPSRAAAFRLPPMNANRIVGARGTPADDRACVSVEAREGVTTGISAADRACTIRILGEERPDPRKLVSPGHIFPIRVREGGVLVKNSLLEGAFDLMRLAGFGEASVVVDLLDRDGEFVVPDTQLRIIEQLKIPLVLLSSITRYRLEHESLVVREAETKIPSAHGGEFRSYIYRSTIHAGEHLALVKGEITPDTVVLTRVQPEFTFSDVFGGVPPTRQIIEYCLRAIGESKAGVFVYLRRPDRGELRRQLEAEEGRELKPAAIMREYGLGAQILRDLGVGKIELLTNSRNRLVGIRSFGIEIVATRQIEGLAQRQQNTEERNAPWQQ